jgi:hypothetical protein
MTAATRKPTPGLGSVVIPCSLGSVVILWLGSEPETGSA